MKIKSISPEKDVFLQMIAGIAVTHKTLYLIGSVPPRRLPVVAIAGTRKPTSYSKEVTFDLAYTPAKKGVVIVSGLALGVDAIAHKAAI